MPSPLRDAEEICALASVCLPDVDVVMQEETFLLRRCDAVGILVARRWPDGGVRCWERLSEPR